MADSRLAEREPICRTTDGAELINGLKDRQQVEIKASQVEHGGVLGDGRPILAGETSGEKHAAACLGRQTLAGGTSDRRHLVPRSVMPGTPA
jgi:hypothetical protein